MIGVFILAGSEIPQNNCCAVEEIAKVHSTPLGSILESFWKLVRSQRSGKGQEAKIF